MSFTIVFTEAYEKQAMSFLKKHPELLERYEKTLRLLKDAPHHPSLRLHPLILLCQIIRKHVIPAGKRVSSAMDGKLKSIHGA